MTHFVQQTRWWLVVQMSARNDLHGSTTLIDLHQPCVSFRVARILHMRMFDLLLRESFLYQFSALARQEKAALKVLHSFTDSVIATRRKELKERKRNVEKENDIDQSMGIKRKMNLMDLLLESACDGRSLTDREIREEVDTFMFEGHDTTTSALSFAIYLFGKYPRVQELAYQEACQVIGKDSKEPATLHQLNELNYLELCIKETLRLFPSVPFFGRKATEEINFSEWRRKRRSVNEINLFVSL